MKLSVRSLKQPEKKKKQFKEVTLMIDSKLLREQITKPIKHSEQTLRRPLSIITMNTNNKPKDILLKTPASDVDLNSTIKRNRHSRSKSSDKRRNTLQRSKSLSNVSDTPHLKSTSFVSKQSNIKCFEKIFFKITDFFEREGAYWTLKRLSYSNIMTLLYQLHYIQFSSQQELMQNNMPQVLKKTYQFWVNLTIKSFTTLQNFIFLVCHIQNITIRFQQIESAINSFDSHLERRQVQFKRFEEYIPEYRFVGVQVFVKWNNRGQIVIDKDSSWKIQQSFVILKTNRLNYNQRSIQQVHVQKVSLSSKTNKLALSKRQKIQTIIRNRKPDIQKITLQDILNFKEDVTDHMPMSARTYEQNKSSILDSLKKQKRTKLKLHRKCGPLTQILSQPKFIKIQSKEELQFERNKQQCTFKPDINPLKIQQSRDLLQIKNVVKTLERMKFVRQSKLQEQQFRQTGWTNNNRRSKSKDHEESINYRPLSDRRQYNSSKENKLQKIERIERIDKIDKIERQYEINKMKGKQNVFKPKLCAKQQIQPKLQQNKQVKQKNKETKIDIRIPLLFIDINIDQSQKQRLVIYQQDSSEDLAYNFAKKHNLSKEMQFKLKDLLEYQMNSVLTKIQEEVEDQQPF